MRDICDEEGNVIATGAGFRPSILDSYTQVISGLNYWREKIEECLVYSDGTHTFDDVCQMVLTGQCQFFNFPNAFAIMEVKVYPRKRVYHCFLAGGNLDGVIACQHPIIEFAKSAGCTQVSLSGRRGWERPFKAHGWKSLCTTLYKDIGDDDGQR